MTAAPAFERLDLGAEPVERLLPRLLGTSWNDQLARYGSLPSLRGQADALRSLLSRSGLTGRGGAGFPTGAKLEAVARRGGAVVVANGVEGEPASAKDKMLLARNPHLVLDGVLVAMEAVGAKEGFVTLAADDERSFVRLESALAERRRETPSILLARLPTGFVSGEESALVSWLNGSEAKPAFKPPRPFERGMNGRPTLVQNVETLANLALLARYGAEWFREVGTPDEPGSVLATVRGAVRRPAVVEVELGTPLDAVIDLCGGLSGPAQAVLVGGYFGTWIRARDLDVPLSQAGLAHVGGSLGARTIVVLPEGACGLAETTRIIRYLAGESAGQCGPCFFGLPALADAFERLARGGVEMQPALARIGQLERQLARRGACSHPDGTLRLAASALAVFADEVERHRVGACSGSAR